MTFTFTNYAGMETPKSPMDAMISKALKAYTGATNARYLPREKEAKIFGAEIGPLAALASNPNFTGFNPQVQQMIAQRIGGYLGGQGGQEGSAQGSPAGYASDEDIYNQLSEGADVTQSPGGKSRVSRSNIAGRIEKFAGENPISKALGGSEIAGKNAAFEQAKQLAAQKLQLKGYPAAQAQQLVQQMPGENNEAYKKRMKPLFVGESNENKSPAHNEPSYDDLKVTADHFKSKPKIVKEYIDWNHGQPMSGKGFREFLAWRNKNV